MDVTGPLKRLSAAIAATGVQNVGFRVVGGMASAVWHDGAAPTDVERATIDAVFATFRFDDDAAQGVWEAAQAKAADVASIDAGEPTPAALLAVALEAAKGGTDDEIKARAKRRIADAKTDRRTSRRALR